VTHSAMLVDEFLPVYAVPASVATVVDADIQTTWDAVLRQYSVRRAKQCRYAPQITQTCSLASENGATFQIIQRRASATLVWILRQGLGAGRESLFRTELD